MQQLLADFEARLGVFEVRVGKLAPLALQDPTGDVDHRAGMTLLMGTALEVFLRDVARTCTALVSARAQAFETLPEPLQRAHFEGGAAALLNVVKDDVKDFRAKKPGASFSRSRDVCRRLASVISGPHELVWEGFARTDSNACPETIKKMLSRFDVSAPWEAVEAAVPPSFYAPLAGSARANKLHAAIADLRDARNRCAHAEVAVAAPPWSSLADYCVALRAVALGLVCVLDGRLQKL